MPTREQLIDAIAEAMSQMEGFHVAHSVAQQNNNPGNLRSWGQMPITASSYAKFPTPEAGWDALKQQIAYNVWGKGPRDPFPLRVSQPLTFKTFYAGQRDANGGVLTGGYPGYSPAADKNNPDAYAKFVYNKVHAALQLGPDVTLDTAIRSVVPVS